MIDLKDVEDLASYDGSPLLRTGIDESGQRWVYYAVREAPTYTEYLVVGSSEERYQEMYNDRLPMREFVTQPASGVAYCVQLRHDLPGTQADIGTVEADKIESYFGSLPEPGVYLNPKV